MRRKLIAVSLLAGVVALVVAACTGSTTSEATPVPSLVDTPPVAVPSPTVIPETPLPDMTQTPMVPSMLTTPVPSPTRTPIPIAEAEARRWRLLTLDFDWKTDFSKTSISAFEVQGTGLERDGIPPIYDPLHETIEQADGWLDPLEPVLVVEVNGVVKAYPFKLLTLHEVVNDEFNGEPIAVTF